MDVLLRIKRLVLERRVHFTEKAKDEMEADDLDPVDVAEAIMSAQTIVKTLRSRSPHPMHASEKLYVIKGYSYKGTPICTKGKFTRREGVEIYVLISAKVAWAK